MAGSKKSMVYKSDNGNNYAVTVDESNGEVAGVPLPTMPKGMVMRYANVHRDGSNRRIWVGKPDSPIMLGSVVSLLLSFFGAGTFAESVAWVVSSVIGEKSPTRPKTADTGILDGDAS